MIFFLLYYVNNYIMNFMFFLLHNEYNRFNKIKII